MTYYKCPKCNGKGKIIDIDWGLGIMTSRMSVLIDLSDSSTCELCRVKVILKDYS